MIYLTYNDAPGGVYQSQVIDTCRFWQETFGEKVLLIALVSGRNYLATRKKIKQAYSNSVVLPMYPGIANWQKNIGILKLAMLLHKKDNVIARGVFAILLARESKLFAKVCFDARGAYMAEWTEYLKGESAEIANDMRKLESAAVLNTDSRIAVSQKLVDYWKENFHYSFLNHVVIPCTLSSTTNLTTTDRTDTRQMMGIAPTEVLLAYSGSSAKWQSFNLLEETITKAFTQNPSLKLLMLCKPGEEKVLADKFPGRVIQKWVDENEVWYYLSLADYGLLLREKSVTNAVSSPVKFAEYLANGLPVIISDNVGDYSAFVKEKNCGMLVNEVNWASLTHTIAEREKIQAIAEQYFRKKSYIEQYRKLF